ncbi:MAG: hypothetical protein HPY83_04835 [Anaerolineae bacterium]|nr:hypothetical protein [Anaerolineae bacterium]
MEYLRSGRPFAVLDPGTAYAKALIVHRGPAGRWVVAGAGVVSYPRRRCGEGSFYPSQAQAASEALRRATQRTLRLAGRELVPACVLISIPMPPALLTVHSGKVVRPRPLAPIGPQEALSRTMAIERAAIEGARASSPQQGAGATPFWLGTAWHAASVDGRPVTALEGFRGTDVHLEVGVATVDASASFWRDWGHSLGVRPILVPESLWVGQVLPRHPGCLLLDLGGHRTHIYLQGSEGGLCRAELPIGGHYFTRYLSLAAGVSPSRAERLKLAYSGGRLRSPSEQRTRQVIRHALRTWTRRLVTVLAAVGQPLPGRWLATGAGSSLPDLSLLPGLLASDSILPLHRYPVLQPLALDDACRNLVAGPERLGPAHAVALTVADWWVRLGVEPDARAQVVRVARMASAAGFEVDADWLKS